MSEYIKQNFTKGQTLKADHLNHMEDGIANVAEQINGLSGGASSWNDLTDKPFEATSMWEDVFSDDNWVFSEDEEGYARMCVVVPNVGETCKVSYNGTEYTVVVKSLQGMPILGNTAPMGIGEDTGEPFVLVIDRNTNEAMGMPLDGATEFDVDIKCYRENVTQLDAKFYNGSVIYYGMSSAPEGWLYSDPLCTSKVTMEELRLAMHKSIVVIAQGDYFQPVTISFSYDGYGYVVLLNAFLSTSGDILHPDYGVLYTAEKEL